MLRSALLHGSPFVTGSASSLLLSSSTTTSTSSSSSSSSPGSRVRSDRELIKCLLRSRPDLLVTMQSFTRGNKLQVFYQYDEREGIWRRINYNTLDNILVNAMTGGAIQDLSERERRAIESEARSAAYRRTFGKCLNEQAVNGSLNDERFDLHRDLFALRNARTLDVTHTPPLRATRAEDRVALTCGWAYDPELAKRHAEDVRHFLSRLFPRPEERRVVLQYVASLMHGHRLDKRLLIVTDERGGNNGKSTFFTLLHKFFGPYLKESTKFLCRASFEKDRDSHDASLEDMRNRRVLLVDELKSYMRLNEAFIKKITSSECVIDGRSFGSASYFSYVWQAGVIISFNQHDCAKFDTRDEALIERLLVCPMRSKFVRQASEANESNRTYPMDPRLSERFDDWRSSLMDLLLEHYTLDGTAHLDIPESMLEARKTLVRNVADPDGTAIMNLNDWLETRIVPTSSNDQYVTIDDIMSAYSKYRKRRQSNDFHGKVRSLLIARNIPVVSRHRFRLNNRSHERRNAVFGYRLANTSSSGDDEDDNDGGGDGDYGKDAAAEVVVATVASSETLGGNEDSAAGDHHTGETTSHIT